jgi:hypothetical protein
LPEYPGVLRFRLDRSEIAGRTGGSNVNGKTSGGEPNGGKTQCTLTIGLSVAAIILSSVSFYFQFLRDDIRFALILSQSQFSLDKEAGRRVYSTDEGIAGTFELGFANTGNRPVIVTTAYQSTYRAKPDDPKEFLDMDAKPAGKHLRRDMNARMELAKEGSKSRCKRDDLVNATYVVPDGTKDFRITVVKSGEMTTRTVVRCCRKINGKDQTMP